MTHLQGLTTMVLTADDVDAAADWYSDTLGIGPYFRRPETGPAAYVEFRIGPDEDELGIRSTTSSRPWTRFSPVARRYTLLRPNAAADSRRLPSSTRSATSSD